MKRFLPVLILVTALLAACSTTSLPSLNGRFSGNVYSNGYYIGAMAVSISSSGTSLSGVGCFVGIDYSEACNTLSGSLDGSSMTFWIGSLGFSGSWTQNTLATTFRSSDGSVSGFVTFDRYASAAALSEVVPDEEAKTVAGLVSAAVASQD